jgi:NAD(P)-dependent dehydrogenase (short-subunit alcohol dehydrogenase family)
LIGLPGRAAYHATKHGVIGLTRSAALDMQRAASGSTRCARAPSTPPWFPRCSPKNRRR